MYIGIFLLIFLMMSSSFKSDIGGSSLPIYNAKIAIFDHDNSPLSRALAKYLGERATIVTASREDKDSLLDDIYSRRLEYALIIPEGFQEISNKDGILNLKSYVCSDASLVKNVDMMIENFMSNWEFTKQIFGGNPQGKELDEAIESQMNVMNTEVPSTLVVGKKGDMILGLKYYLSFLDYIMIATSFLIIGQPFVITEGPIIKRRDVASGFSERKRTTQLFCAAYLCQFLVWLLMIAASFLMTSTELLTQEVMPYMLASSFVNMLAIASFAMLFANIFPSSGAMSFFSTILSLLIAFSSGIFVPAEFLWEPFHRFSMIFPPYWDVKNQTEIHAAIVGGRSLAPYYQGLFVMAGMGALYFALSLIIRHSKNLKAKAA